MTKNNSVKQMVAVLQKNAPMTENEIFKAAFDYDRNYHGTVMGQSNKKYADMLRRGLSKGIIYRVETEMHGKAKYAYYSMFKNKVECSVALDNEMANESI